MNKSPDAFRTISEVAEQLDVPAHVLRFWETRFNQVKPIKRGGGRRYYRPDDVRLLRGIRGLLYDDGMTIKGVQKILREQGVRHVIGLGTIDEHAAPAVAKVAAPVRAPLEAKPEPVLATAGGGSDPLPMRSATAGGDGRGRSQDDLFAAQAAVEHQPPPDGAAESTEDGGAEAAGDVLPPISHKVDREALRRLVAELESLRRVMAGSG